MSTPHPCERLTDGSWICGNIGCDAAQANDSADLVCRMCGKPPFDKPTSDDVTPPPASAAILTEVEVTAPLSATDESVAQASSESAAMNLEEFTSGASSGRESPVGVGGGGGSTIGHRSSVGGGRRTGGAGSGAGGGLFSTVVSGLKHVAKKVVHEVSQPNSQLRTGLSAAHTELKAAARVVHHELTDSNSKLRTEVIAPVVAAGAAAVKEVTNPQSRLRTVFVPAAAARTSEVAHTVASATRTVVHEVSDPHSNFRENYVAPAAAATVSAAKTVAHEVSDPHSFTREKVVAPTIAAAKVAAHEVADPHSNFRENYVAPAAAAAKSAAKTVAHEVSDPNSRLRHDILPATGKVLAAGGAALSEAAKSTAKAVAHEVTDDHSDFRAKILPTAKDAVVHAAHTLAHEVSDPTSNLRTHTVETLGHGVATGVGVAAAATKIALVVGADAVGRGVEATSHVVSGALGSTGTPMHISDTTKARLETAHRAVAMGATATGVVAQVAGAAAASLGKAVGTMVSASGAGSSLEHSTVGRAVLEIGVATVGAAGTVFSGAVEGASVLGVHTAHATTDFVGTRYGEEARAAAESTAAVAGEMGHVVVNATLAGPTMLLAQAVGAATLTSAAHAEETAASTAAASTPVAPAVETLPLPPVLTPAETTTATASTDTVVVDHADLD